MLSRYSLLCFENRVSVGVCIMGYLLCFCNFADTINYLYTFIITDSVYNYFDSHISVSISTFFGIEAVYVWDMLLHDQ